MTLLSQIREEAAIIADGMALEIIERAQTDLTRSRFERLRKGKTFACTETEKEYMHALRCYVDAKLIMRKLVQIHHKLGLPPRYWDLEKKRNYYREQMDRIEYNIVWRKTWKIEEESTEIATATCYRSAIADSVRETLFLRRNKNVV